MKKKHPCPQYDSFKIISRNNTKKIKLSEAL